MNDTARPDSFPHHLRHSLRMYRRMAGLSLRSQWAYKSSLMLSILAQFLIIGVEFLGLLLLFQRFGRFLDWSLPEMAFLYGVVNVTFAVADALAYGFDTLGNLIKTGNFDRLLLRPLPTLLQLLGMEITIKRSGRVFLGLSTALWAWASLPTGLTWAAPLHLLAALFAGIIVFLSVFLIQAACTFITIEGLEFMNAFSYGGQQMASYPLLAYRKFMRSLFLAIVPIGACIYLPVCSALGRQALPGLQPWLQVLGPLAAIPFALCAFALWQLGQRRYSSAGG